MVCVNNGYQRFKLAKLINCRLLKNCVNISKTKVVSFKPSRNLKLNGKILYPTVSVKFLDINIDGYLNWKQRVSDIAIKQIRSYLN